VPSTLLVLSNAFMYASNQPPSPSGPLKEEVGTEDGEGKDGAKKHPEFNSQIDALQAVLSSIPEELFHEIELEVHTAEGAATNAQRLEVLKEQQELIEEEAEQHAEGAEDAGEKPVRAAPKDDVDIDEEHAAAAADAAAVLVQKEVVAKAAEEADPPKKAE
jgi:LETM1 and EF-hand domain-containing protein 1